MAEPATRSSTQRWVFDLQACQTRNSFGRGVARYSEALFNALRTHEPDIDFRVVASAALPHPRPATVPPDKVVTLPPLPEGLGLRKAAGGPQDDLDGILLSARIAPLKADLIHVSHVFEGFDDRVALPSPAFKAAGQILSATLYDLIPLRLPQHYLQDAAFAAWYRTRVDWLRQADLLLAISESTRNDACELLGIPPSRIVTVHGGVAPCFVPAADAADVRTALRRRYALRDRFVLYTGGDDYRKNIAGAIRAYAAVPGPARRQCQLVVACAMDDGRKAAYRDLGRQAGLSDGDLLIVGFVSDADLVAFYQCCDAFLFPSLYEGLGLPVLEAMACGAPTIGGNNSSVRELIARDDALFDAQSDVAIAAALARVLTDAAFAASLQAHGLQRARSFSWERTAALASAALADAMLRTRHAGAQAASNGWLPRKRLAVVTPLPPCKSGIADYNAQFLPYLARHFDIDVIVKDADAVDPALAAVFRILQARQFEGVAHLYDAILYELGNSEFHAYMLPLLSRFPGVVTLHDAYLSGLYGFIDFAQGQAGSYARTMIDIHGSRARRILAPAVQHPEPNGATMVELPCTKQVLDAALGVVSHSPFNLELARCNHPEGWAAPYRTIAQMVAVAPARSTGAAQAKRRRLGLSPSALVVASFGHVAWTKWGDLVLDAFLASTLRQRPDAVLLYVGELAQDAFAHRLTQAIAASGLGDRIRITGFVEPDHYQDYLAVADIAVQLRTKSRGGTPKGVLDCLAHGVPVIVNNDASYRDYPADVVFKLPAVPSAAHIAQAFDALSTSIELRQGLGERGLRYVAQHNDPERCASRYAATIAECLERARVNRHAGIVDAMAPLAARIPSPVPAIQALANFVDDAAKAPTFQRRRVFVDVSFIAAFDHGTGIQRVVRNVVHHFYTTDRAGIDAVAVVLQDGLLHVASAWLSSRGLLHPAEPDSTDPGRAVAFAPGDILLMLDSSWDRFVEFDAVIARARANGARIVTVVYDLLPLQLPPPCFQPGAAASFKNWLVHGAVNRSDALVAISRTVALDLQRFIEEEPAVHARPRVDHWHLGSDPSDSSRPQGNRLSDLSNPYLLMVGTVEPRKLHDVALAAFEALWAEGCELGLCIAGRHGWLRDDLMERLRGHRERGHRLQLVENATDEELAALYQRAQGLLLLSLGEGFGLPLVEAAHHGIPILCSDIPVFKEVCGEWATYVEGATAEQVALQVQAWWGRKQRGQVPATTGMPRLTWEQSARSLMDVIVGDRRARRCQEEAGDAAPHDRHG